MVISLKSDRAGKVVNMETEAGTSFSYEQIKKTVEEHKPAVLFLCQVRPTALHRACRSMHMPPLGVHYFQHAAADRALS